MQLPDLSLILVVVIFWAAYVVLRRFLLTPLGAVLAARERRVEHRDRAALPDDPGVGAAEGEGARIGAQHAAYAGGGLLHLSGRQGVFLEEGDAHLFLRIAERLSSRCKMYRPEATISTAPASVLQLG